MEWEGYGDGDGEAYGVHRRVRGPRHCVGETSLGSEGRGFSVRCKEGKVEYG